MTLPGKTPEEPGNRRQADGPQVLPERAKDEDMRELQEPHHSRSPMTPIADRPTVPSTRSSSTSSRLAARRTPPLGELLERGGTRDPEPDLEAEP